SRRQHTRFSRDWSSDVCSSDLPGGKERRNQTTDERQDDRGQQQKVARHQIVLPPTPATFASFSRTRLNIAAEMRQRNSNDSSLEIGRASCREKCYTTATP